MGLSAHVAGPPTTRDSGVPARGHDDEAQPIAAAHLISGGLPRYPTEDQHGGAGITPTSGRVLAGGLAAQTQAHRSHAPAWEHPSDQRRRAHRRPLPRRRARRRGLWQRGVMPTPMGCSALKCW